MELIQLTAAELSEKIRRKEISVLEAVRASLDQIRKMEPEIHSFVTVTEEYAYRRAEEVEKGIRDGRYSGPLAGVPAAVKDNICTAGIPTTCSSRMLEGFVPPYPAEAVRRLEQAGAVIIGKTNMDEFAMGSTTETSAFGITRNPWDRDRVPGGSSGGSCAAVAAGEAFFALGSDTGGSIRQPSSWCGVTGMKPTYGTVSRNGLIAYGSSLDQIGPVAKNVKDCALALEAVASWDPMDSTSMKRQDLHFSENLTGDVRGFRVGIPREYVGEGVEPDVRRTVERAAELLEAAGARVEQFSLKNTRYAIPTYYIIASAEASSNLSRFDGVKYGYRTPEYEGLHEMYKRSRSQGFGPEVKRRIMLGSFVLSSGYYDAYYLKALRAKAVIKEDFDQAFSRYDVILGPAAPTAATRIGESLKDPIQMYLGDIFTVSVNLAGLPALTLPAGMTEDGLPVGVQIIGGCFQERKIFQAASSLEQALEPWHMAFEKEGNVHGKTV